MPEPIPHDEAWWQDWAERTRDVPVWPSPADGTPLTPRQARAGGAAVETQGARRGGRARAARASR